MSSSGPCRHLHVWTHTHTQTHMHAHNLNLTSKGKNKHTKKKKQVGTLRFSACRENSPAPGHTFRSAENPGSVYYQREAVKDAEVDFEVSD